jgi:hypothetical protein
MRFVTVIKVATRDVVYTNLVYHDCPCGEFFRDIQREAREFNTSKKGEASRLDVFWHLDEYCEKKYGPCYWQIVTIDSLL